MSGTQETALTLARELSGAGEAEEALLELLCQAAEQQWEKRLRPGMTTEDCGKAFPCAVAFTAAADLAAARASGGDFIVACVHWGDEYQRRENAAQRSLAAFLRRHGTDVVVGSHPHVIQPWVADSSHVVLYSLGNLVSGQRRRYTDGGLVATVEAVRHPEGRMTYRLETTPVWVSVPGYRILTPEAADTMTLPAAYGIFRADLDALPGNGL